MNSKLLPLFFGGLLPIIAFTVIEEKYGPVWGTVAGMFFGGGEILYEWLKYRKVSSITWIGNALILVMGGISIFTQEGLWFKLQPAIFEGFFAFFLWGSLLLKRNFLVQLAQKQGQNFPPQLLPFLNGLTFRVGLFFFIHMLIATWAALYASTTVWAWLKGLGLTLTFILYLAAEILFLRKRIRAQVK